MLIRPLALAFALSLLLAAQPPSQPSLTNLDLDVQKAQLAFERAELDRDKMKQALEVVTSEAVRKSMAEELATLEKVVETRRAELASLRLRQRETDLGRRERALQQAEAPPSAPPVPPRKPVARVKDAPSMIPKGRPEDELASINPSDPRDSDYVEIPEFKISDKLRETLKKAETGDANAQYEVGYAYDSGIGAGQDYHKAMHWYRKAAGQGHVKAIEGVAWLHYFGQGTPVAKDEAAKWFARCVEQNDSCRRGQALLLRKGEGGLSADPKRAQRILDDTAKSLQAKASRGDAEAALSLGYLLHGENDFNSALKWYKVAAKLGSADGAFWAARSLVDSNHANDAMPYLRQASDLGHVGAINWIGLQLEVGKGVAHNLPEAMKLYLRAAEMGNTTAMGNLAVNLITVGRIADDYGEGAKWLRIASALGNARAQRLLATVWYIGGDARALYWLKKALASGDKEAMADLAVYYTERLRQNDEDRRVGMEWAQKASAAGSKRGTELVKKYAEWDRLAARPRKPVSDGPGFWERASQITGAINEGLAQANANAGNRSDPTTRYPTTRYPTTPTRSTASTTCTNWSPRLERLLASEHDPTFAADLRNHKSNPNTLADLVAKSGGAAASRRLIELQIAEYQQNLRSQGNETALGHTEVRDRLQRSIEYNAALLDLVGTCVP
jgi:TPR repeat protein